MRGSFVLTRDRALGLGPPLARAFALALAFAIVVASSATAGRGAWEGSQPYTGQPVGGGCSEVAGHPCPQVPDSAVQFGPFAAPPTALDLRIRDALGERIGATFILYGADGAPLASGAFCGATSRVAAPNGTYYVTVSLDSPANLGHHCGLPRYGTAGHVLLRLRDGTSAQEDNAA